jgi:hypothetical protein
MITRWTLVFLSAWILFAAPAAPAPAAAPAIVCSQTQQVEYAPPVASPRLRTCVVPLAAPARALPPYQPAPQNRPPPAAR